VNQPTVPAIATQTEIRERRSISSKLLNHGLAPELQSDGVFLHVAVFSPTYVSAGGVSANALAHSAVMADPGFVAGCMALTQIEESS